MKKQSLSEEQLQTLPRETLVLLLVQQAESFRLLSDQSAAIQKQNEALIKQVEDLKEQLSIMNNRLFGRKSEKVQDIPGQLSLDIEDSSQAFNETEALVEEGFADEPEVETVVIRRRAPRPKGKRELDLKEVPTEREDHYLTEEELQEKFPHGWKQLEDEVYKELIRIPETFKVMEHHIGVYAGKGAEDTVIRGKAPGRLLNHSILTPSLAASVYTAKFVNALPYNRVSEWYAINGITLSRQVMAGWMIRIYEYYLEQVHKRMKAELFLSHIIHCDETPF
ncbi:MAG: transposase, partial [Lachnospiraceae bacterium]|nr:transposase [Lachnospiraceae bacterium]